MIESYERSIDEQIEASFKKYLAEALTVPNVEESMNKRRHAMPQLSQFDAFMSDLDKNGIDSEVQTLSPNKLKPTQGNFSEEKVDKLINEKLWDNKPIISSSDGYVIDGHHRWLAAAKLGKDIKSRVISISADDLLSFLKDKPYVETKTIKE